MNPKNSIKEIALLFLKLGIIGFGGPAAHIAMMRDEVVTKRKWMTDPHFMDLVGATNLIPGPNSTEMAIHLGREKGGGRGLIIAGLCFILPAVLITLIFAWLYKQYGVLPEIQPFIYGIKPAIIAIILSAIFPLAQKSLKTVTLGILGLIALVLALLNFSEIGILFGSGFLALAITYFKNNKDLKTKVFFPFWMLPVSKTVASISNLNLFLIFLKIGAILYGSGYVLFAFLDSELVATGIVSRQVLMDAISVGQFTPGPVFSSVTFIGYQINSWTGALVATIGVFLPSFIFVAFLNPLVKKMRNSKMLSVFLDAVNVASVALIIVVCYKMGKESITDWRTILIAITSLVVTFGFKKINSAYVVIGSALLGYVLFLV